jgi:hypothetical protein
MIRNILMSNTRNQNAPGLPLIIFSSRHDKCGGKITYAYAHVKHHLAIEIKNSIFHEKHRLWLPKYYMKWRVPIFILKTNLNSPLNLLCFCFCTFSNLISISEPLLLFNILVFYTIIILRLKWKNSILKKKKNSNNF